MTSMQRLVLGDTEFAFHSGQSAHGRWRTGYARAVASSLPTALALTLDAGRFVFVLAEGGAALAFARQACDYLWTLDAIGDDWPAPLVARLEARTHWQDLPAGPWRFVAGRLDRQLPISFLSLAWLGLPPARLLDRALTAIDLGTDESDSEALWSPQDGPVTGLRAYRGSLFGMERLLLLSPGADILAAGLPDLSNARLEQALQDWRADATRDLVVLDIRLSPALAAPSAVMLTCRWVAPDLCELRWNPSPNATGYRLETAPTPDFAAPELLAELTDGRQIRYQFSPPPDRPVFIRAVPLNQGVAGAASQPVCPLPLTLIAPLLQSVRWSADGGYTLTWTPIPQATGYEVQEAPGERFEASEATIVYRGDRPECRLPLGTPPGHFYRVRAINALYAPTAPSPWSDPVPAPARLDTPVFTEVTDDHLAWTSVPGAQSYLLRVVPLGADERQGEEMPVSEPSSAVAHAPATYRVRALRQAHDLLTASEWSAPVTVAPAAYPTAPPARPSAPLILGVALVALLVGAALGLMGLRAYQDANATATPTPLPQEAIAATFEVATLAADRATQVVALETAMQRTLDAEMTRTHQPSATPSPTLTFTSTYPPSPTPNATATRDAIIAAFAADLTHTAAAFTATPTPSATLTPSPTPNATATRDAIIAAFAADLTHTAAAFTATPTPSATLTPSPTPNATATRDAIIAAF
ncbi:MAG: hypothetical protein ACUVSU_16670, partial [Aggregatilineaceae bacterium]